MPEEIYISAEVGLRKDRGDIWPKIAKKYKADLKTFVHLGDNHVSDCQNPGDHKIKNMHIMSAKELFEISQSTISKPSFYPNLREFVSNAESRRLSENVQKYFSSPFGL
jgi:predicted HAD superfamily hydrolase